MATPIVTQATTLEGQFVEIANALDAAIALTPAATRETYSSSKSVNASGKTISFTFTMAAVSLPDDQVVGLAPKAILI